MNIQSKTKIGISLTGKYGESLDKVIKTMADTGFNAISPNYSDKLPLVIRTAADCGLEIQSMHAPYGNSVGMWRQSSIKYEPAMAELMTALESCVKYNIPTMVAHVWIGFDYSFGETGYGFENYEKIIRQAEKYGVKIAFENTEGHEYLIALMEHFKSCETVGFCFDSGHEICYNPSEDMLARFGDRLAMTHLNDNIGISNPEGKIFWADDLHMIPYDGNADWDYILNRLSKSKKQDILNFEVKIDPMPGRTEKDIYQSITLKEYLSKAYDRAFRIVNEYSRLCALY